MNDDRLDFHLDNWRRYMKAGEGILGYSGTAAGCVGGGNSQDFDAMVGRADMRCAIITDAVIRGLDPSEQAALNHTYLRAVFRFPRDNLAKLLESAKLKVSIGLKARGVW